jgi:hypothetical protein
MQEVQQPWQPTARFIETFPVGTTLYECRVCIGDVVVVCAVGHFALRACLAYSVAERCSSARLLAPARQPRRLTRRCGELYSLIGTQIAGVVRACKTVQPEHELASAGKGRERSRAGCLAPHFRTPKGVRGVAEARRRRSPASEKEKEDVDSDADRPAGSAARLQPG